MHRHWKHSFWTSSIVNCTICRGFSNLYFQWFQGRFTKQKEETPWEMSEVNISTLPKNNLFLIPLKLSQFLASLLCTTLYWHWCLWQSTGLLDSSILCLKSFNLWWLLRKDWTVCCFQTFTFSPLGWFYTLIVILSGQWPCV